MSVHSRIEKAMSFMSEHASGQSTLEAVTPGEYRRRGQGVAIQYGLHDTPLGKMFVAVTRRGVCRMEFLEDRSADEVSVELRNAWPEGELARNDNATSHVIDMLFNEQGACRHGSWSLHVVGTDFQVAVWRALLKIPPAKLASYSEIASALGRPKASRAVGNAVAANPVALLIPCHRVIQKSGAIGGYRWGTNKKQRVQMWENLRREQTELL
ncbi:methylated-DNA--[protein]-cysteine S-methyltransferase [Marinobacter orientalis]|uniref:methylated-DNA--[protein]-cysteine S-methyltransferase n=1 Tax=Marinobacter orientalis TaxID=1928859 RepID=A0A7Y0WSY8_9GAMM|nr:methylated-DNA--[protein]-cysteine S-methyltransferase [Marinobacter orientalis]NMT64225.1 methylated-DNA--[protein]-cysteine S-methyltransferase [Marinobacter orientalis]TGX49448.1 methylated-DNA--[protein]-cysteine S-methyltransferase [Marinobacter orientalis]